MDPKNPRRGKFEYGGGPDLFQIFTDGSLHEGIAGSGVNIALGAIQLSFNIGKKSVFQAEIFAIQKACQWLIKNNEEIRNKEVVIYSDSQSSLKALASVAVSSKCVLRTIYFLNGVAAKCKSLKLVWVRAHTGACAPNDVADRLANEGRLLPEAAPDAPKTPWSLIKSDLVNKTNIYWSWDWYHQPTCRQSKQFFPAIDKSRSFKIIMLNRMQFAKFTQLAVGHNGLAWFKDLSKNPDDEDTPPPICAVCNEDDQTSAHVLGACPAYALNRWEIFGQPFISPPFDDLKINLILRFMTETKLQPLQWHHTTQQTSSNITPPPTNNVGAPQQPSAAN